MVADSISVLIVGCGNIAGRFDQLRSKNDLPLTHAGAYRSDGRFRLAACVEPDDERRAEFMRSWDVAAGFRSIEEAIDSHIRFDVVSICSPSSFHARDLEVAIRSNPKLIFCEKPLTTSLADAERLVKTCREKSVLLAVNFSRRFDPDVRRLQADIREGRLGTLRSIAGWYNKGMLNNGSHMVDLLHLLVGPVKIVTVGLPTPDFFPDDPTIPVGLEGSGKLPIQLLCGHAEDYAIFEMQLLFSTGTLIMEEGGLFWRERRVVDSGSFPGYRVLDAGVRREGRILSSMLRAVEDVYETLTAGKPLASTGETALDTQRVCEQIMRRAAAMVRDQ